VTHLHTTFVANTVSSSPHVSGQCNFISCYSNVDHRSLKIQK